MLDRWALRGITPVADGLARRLAARGVSADAVTWLGFAVGIAAAVAIATGHPGAGLALLLLSRAADALDGAVARATAPTARGAFLDITLDFLFYAAIPLAFAIDDPVARALPTAVLLAAFIGTGASFLAFAAQAARRGWTNPAYPRKGLYYLGGLTEATETLACFALMCLWPEQYALWAYGFAALCGLTIVTRIAAGVALLSEGRP